MKSALMKPPSFTVVPGKAAGVSVMFWIGALPAGTGAGTCACTALTSSICVSFCCCWLNKVLTSRSSSATRASSACSRSLPCACAAGTPNAATMAMNSAVLAIFVACFICIPSLKVRAVGLSLRGEFVARPFTFGRKHPPFRPMSNRILMPRPSPRPRSTRTPRESVLEQRDHGGHAASSACRTRTCRKSAQVSP